mmetsp:Transcript_36997/g.33261  ORF Transcript_36997/g.33261 Transcript_36997/m.33261 type:complete len:94 (-) Transcript_36997:63-344(-)
MNLRNVDGLTPIMLAIQNDSFNIFCIFLEEDCIVDESLKSPDGETLMEMCEKYSPDCYEYYKSFTEAEKEEVHEQKPVSSTSTKKENAAQKAI